MANTYSIPIIVFFLTVTVLTTSSKYSGTSENESAKLPSNNIVSNVKPVTIHVLPLGSNLPKELVLNTYKEIKKYIPHVQLESSVSLPASTFYKPRNRYRADKLIHWMSTRAKSNQLFLGITNVDISTTKGEHKDWGVMGLAYRPGNAAVASNYRLKNKSSFWKIAIHELGHTTGLPHCPVKTCFMRDADGGDPTGEEKEFCIKCKAVLVQNGWRL